jgi:V/A-type H+-transporting ATPase subunit E
MAESSKVGSGVQSLIDRIRDEGVQAAQREADRVLQEAQKQAADMVAQARAEAEGLRSQARAEIKTERAAAQEALRLASRDTMLAFRAELTKRFTQAVKGLVGVELKDREFLRQMLLAIASQAVPDKKANRPLEVLLSNELFPENEAERQSLRSFILALAHEMIQAGIELKSSGENKPGIRIRLAGEDLEIDMTDEAISALLLKHLLPRFRAIGDEVTQGT